MAKLYLGSREMTPAIVGGRQAPTYYRELELGANDKLIPSKTTTHIMDFTDVKDIWDYTLAYAYYQNTAISGAVDMSDLTAVSGAQGCGYTFYGCTGLTSVDLSSLTTVSSSNGCYNMFYNCTGLTSADLSSLTTVSANNACYGMFSSCTGLTSVNVSGLTTISGMSGCSSMFSNCTGLTSVNLASLTTVSASNSCYSMFLGCKNLESLSFPALTTTSFGSYVNQFSNMLVSTGKSKTHTIHFPSNLETTIQGLTGYPLFGGTSGYVTLSFDLPATS